MFFTWKILCFLILSSQFHCLLLFCSSHVPMSSIRYCYHCWLTHRSVEEVIFESSPLHVLICLVRQGRSVLLIICARQMKTKMQRMLASLIWLISPDIWTDWSGHSGLGKLASIILKNSNLLYQKYVLAQMCCWLQCQTHWGQQSEGNVNHLPSQGLCVCACAGPLLQFKSGVQHCVNVSLLPFLVCLKRQLNRAAYRVSRLAFFTLLKTSWQV